LKKIHKGQFEKHINTIVQLTHEDVEELIDALTDMVSIPEDSDDFEKTAKRLVANIESVEKFGGYLRTLRSAFEYKLDSNEQVEVFKGAIIKTSSRLQTVYKFVREDLESTEESIEELFITKQILYQCLKLAKAAETNQDSTTEIQKASVMYLFHLSMLLLRLEAARRGKIGYGELYKDIAVSNTLTKNYVLDESKIASIHEILGLAY
jgi:hypothetical protein